MKKTLQQLILKIRRPVAKKPNTVMSSKKTYTRKQKHKKKLDPQD